MQSSMVDSTAVLLRSFQILLWLTLSPLAALVVVGVVLSLILSILQIQDQGLPTAAKIVTLIAFLMAAGHWMSSTLIGFTTEIFSVLDRV